MLLLAALGGLASTDCLHVQTSDVDMTIHLSSMEGLLATSQEHGNHPVLPM